MKASNRKDRSVSMFTIENHSFWIDTSADLDEGIHTRTHNERWVWTFHLALVEVESYSDSRMSCSCGNNFNCSNVSDRRSCVNYDERQSEQPFDSLAGRKFAYITFGISGEKFILAEHTPVAGQVVEENLDETRKGWSTVT